MPRSIVWQTKSLQTAATLIVRIQKGIGFGSTGQVRVKNAEKALRSAMIRLKSEVDF